MAHHRLVKRVYEVDESVIWSTFFKYYSLASFMSTLGAPCPSVITPKTWLALTKTNCP